MKGPRCLRPADGNGLCGKPSARWTVWNASRPSIRLARRRRRDQQRGGAEAGMRLVQFFSREGLRAVGMPDETGRRLKVPEGVGRDRKGGSVGKGVAVRVSSG